MTEGMHKMRTIRQGNYTAVTVFALSLCDSLFAIQKVKRMKIKNEKSKKTTKEYQENRTGAEPNRTSSFDLSHLT